MNESGRRQLRPSNPLNAYVGRGGSVEVIVSTAGGEPAKGALVRVGSPIPVVTLITGDKQGTTPPPIESRVDDQGRAVIEGVAPGSVLVTASLDGYVPWSRWIGVLQGRSSQVFVLLETGASIWGFVWDKVGNPISGASVAVTTRASISPLHQTRTDARGYYKIEGLPGGSVRVRAGATGKSYGLDEFDIASDDTVRQDFRLADKTVEVRGRVEDSDGRGLAGLWVTFCRLGRADFVVCHSISDADGMFELCECGSGTGQIVVRRSQSMSGFPLAVVQNVSVGDYEVRVVVDVSTADCGYVIGRTMYENGQCADRVTAQLSSKRKLGSVKCEVESGTGRFDFGAVPVGDYEIEVRHVNRIPLPSILVSVAPGEVYDCGDITMESSGWLEARIAMDAGDLIGSIECRIYAGVETRESIVAKSVGPLPDRVDLAPGVYTLCLNGSHILAKDVPFVIAPEASTPLDVTISNGMYRTIRFIEPESREPSESLLLEVRDEADRLSLVRTLFPVRRGEYECEVLFWGHLCTLIGTTNTGLYASASCSIGPAPRGTVIIVELREPPQ